MLLAKKALKKNLKEAVLDAGFLTTKKSAKIYAVLKGCVDGGLNIPFQEGIFPSDERISGSI